MHLLSILELSLVEDGPDLTTEGVFGPRDRLQAIIVAKEQTIIAGLPVIPLVMDLCAAHPEELSYTWQSLAKEGEEVAKGSIVARISGPARQVLRAERVILNFVSHLCGIANLTRRYAEKLEGTGVRLLDTRKTMPGLRYPDKYAVLCGGGHNHRRNLAEMLMLKDNHIDAAGSMTKAVELLPQPRRNQRGRRLQGRPHHARQYDARYAPRSAGNDPLLHRNGDQRGRFPRHHPGVCHRKHRPQTRLHFRRTHHALRRDRRPQHAHCEGIPMTTAPLSNDARAIEELRSKLGGRLTIVGHHYEQEATIQHCDIRGDSLELARRVPGIASDYIVFCGVYFMAESAALLAREGQQVLLPDHSADCVMAQMTPARLLDRVLGRLTASGRKLVPLAYVNTSLAVKAVVGRYGGAGCTSANAEKMMNWAFRQGDGVLFLPDKNLARNTARKLGITGRDTHILDVRKTGEAVDLEAADKAALVLWPGLCAIHARFHPEQIEAVRKADPSCKVIVHPECSPEVVRAADGAGSTTYIIEYVRNAPDGAHIYVGTEINLVERLAREQEGRIRVEALRSSACSNMAKITPEKLRATLEGIVAGNTDPITVPSEDSAPAKASLERMLEACA